MRPVARFVEPRTSEERPVLLGKPPRARRRPRPETLEFGDRTLRANDAVVNTWDNEIENMKQTQVPGYLQSTTSSRIKDRNAAQDEGKARHMSVDLGCENRATSTPSKSLQQVPALRKSTSVPCLGKENVRKNQNSFRRNSSRHKPAVPCDNVRPEKIKRALESIDADIVQTQRELEELDIGSSHRRAAASQNTATSQRCSVENQPPKQPGGQAICRSTARTSIACDGFKTRFQNNQKEDVQSTQTMQQQTYQQEGAPVLRIPELVPETTVRNVSNVPEVNEIQFISKARARSLSNTRSRHYLLQLIEEDQESENILDSNRKFIESQRQRLNRSSSFQWESASVCSSADSLGAWKMQESSANMSVASSSVEEKGIQCDFDFDVDSYAHETDFGYVKGETRMHEAYGAQVQNQESVNVDVDNTDAVLDALGKVRNIIVGEKVRRHIKTKEQVEVDEEELRERPDSPCSSVISFSSVRFRCRRRRVVL